MAGWSHGNNDGSMFSPSGQQHQTVGGLDSANFLRPLKVSPSGGLQVTGSDTSSDLGFSYARATNVTGSTVVSVGSTALNVWAVYAINPNAVPVYLKFCDVGSAVTIGTSAVKSTYLVPATNAIYLGGELAPEMRFSNNVQMYATTGLADSDTTDAGGNVYVRLIYSE